MPLISVIVPIYNVDSYLFQCIQSIIDQSYESLEIILVNDGSTDNSPIICEFFRKFDKRVIVINKTNGGLVSARKAGIAASTGEYIYYVDGDDWLDKDCLEQMIKPAQEWGVDIVISKHHREFVGVFTEISNNIPSGFYNKQQLRDRIYPSMISSQDFFRHGINTYSWGKLFKRNLALDLQLSIPDRIIMGEDAALVYPALYGANSIFIADYAGYNYRQRANSILKVIANEESELEKLSYLFRYLQKKLKENSGEQNFLKQLQEYFFALALIRTGAFLNNLKYFKKLRLLNDVPLGSRICLYSSGSFGQHIYKNILITNCFKLAGWFDDDYKESEIAGLPVCDPAAIAALKYEFVIVATVDSQKFYSIRQDLEDKGVPSKTIKGLIFQTKDISGFINCLGYSPINFDRIATPESNNA